MCNFHPNNAGGGVRVEALNLRDKVWGMREEGGGVREKVWKVKCERGGEGWWKWACFWSGSGSIIFSMDPDPAIWCRSFGSGSATLSQSINILQSHKKLQPGNYRHHTCPFLTMGARHRRKIYQSLFGGQIPCRASYFASVVLEE